jgi:diguanylate cyclase (GGDEF)-like protein
VVVARTLVSILIEVKREQPASPVGALPGTAMAPGAETFDPLFEAQAQGALAACLGRIRGGVTLDETAQALCDQLCALPWVDSAEVDAFGDDHDAVVLAVRARSGSPFHSGDRLPSERTAHLRDFAAGGVAWTEAVGTREAAADRPVTAACLPIGGRPVLAVLTVRAAEPGFAAVLTGKAPGIVAFTTAVNALLSGGLQERKTRAELRRRIERELSGQAFHPVFQPIVALATGDLLGFEALTRFGSGRRPDLCFADAWDVGLGVELEFATLRAALDEARRLPPHVWLDLNVTPRLMAHARELRALFETADRPLVLEITEHEPVADYASLRDSVRSLGPGIRLAVDDAGAGAANFAHIIELKPDFVKLDMGLVHGVNTDLGRQALVVAMRHFAQEAGCHLLAEGVETPAEAETLVKLGVTLAQGYLFGRPARAGTFSSTDRGMAAVVTTEPVPRPSGPVDAGRHPVEPVAVASADEGSADAATSIDRWPVIRGFNAGSSLERDRLFARYATVCAVLTVVLVAIGLFAGPEKQRAGLVLIDLLAGPTAVIAIWIMREGFSRGLLVIAGIVLMVLGVAAGAMLTDGLDGAAVMPLAGALLLIPVLRGRRLFAMFVVALIMSMVGEAAAYTLGGLSQLHDSVSAPVSMAQSAVMLAFTYGLVWWVSKEWRIASDRSARATASERQVLTVNERLLATLDPQKVLNLIADSLKSVVDYDNLTIYRVDAAARLLVPVLARDRFAALILESSFSMDRGITGWVASHGESQCVNDAHLDPRMRLIPGTPAEPESLIVVPLLVDGRVLGTLNVGRVGRNEAHFDEREFEVVRLFARQASIALSNADVHQAVWARAQTDEVTALRNRGAFEQQIADLVADDTSRPLTLLMLDLDHFKAFNDRYGHPAGDALLRGVARAIGAAVREREMVFRYGGDEFVVLLPGIEENAGAQVADRIRAAVAASAAVTGVPITASGGAACQATPGGTRDLLVAAADAALYRAKTAGGDRVELSGPHGALEPMAAREAGGRGPAGVGRAVA